MAETLPSLQTSPQLEAGAYEVIRQRLNKHGAELQRRLDLLNNDRKAEFGGIETALLTTTRLTTDRSSPDRGGARGGGGEGAWSGGKGLMMTTRDKSNCFTRLATL